ncbi:MAG: M56 family metallopeptidase [Pirellulaceae bacterium]
MMNSDLLSLLITQTWQVTVLAVVVWFVTRTWTKNRPHLAHALWILVLIKCLTPPVISSPTSAFSWLGADSPSHTVHEELVRNTDQTNSKPMFVSPRDSIVVQAVPQANFAEAKSKTSSPIPIPRAKSVTPSESHKAVNWPGFVTRVWLLGVAIGLVWTSLRMLLFLRWIRASRTSTDSSVERLVEKLRNQLGIRRRVRVRILRSPVGPAVLGVFRPTVLLPASIAAGKSTEQLEPLLAHELIHIRRGDLGWALLQTVAKSLFWFHPLVRMAARMVTRESERSCDEETVASLGCKPVAYAKGLLEVLEHKHQLRIAPALPGVRPVDITSARMERVMNLGNGTHRRTPFWVWLVLIVCGTVVLPGAAMVVAQERLPVLPNPEPSGVLPAPTHPLTLPDGENWRLQTYEITDLIEEYEASVQPAYYLDGKLADLADILGCRHPRPDGTSSTPQGRELQTITDNGIITLGDQHPTMKLVDQRIFVFGDDATHQAVSAAIERFRQFGFRQIVVETHMIRTAVDQLEELGIEWSIAPAGQVVLDSNDPGQQVFQPDQAGLLVVTEAGVQGIANNSSVDIANLVLNENVAATSYVERNSPVLYATVDNQQVTQIVTAAKSDEKTTLFNAPTITMYNGQNATVVTGSQRPLVVGLNQVTDESKTKTAYQPVIRVINEGTILSLNAEIVDNLINLDCRLEQSQILNVETMQVPLKDAGANQPSIQIPEVATMRVQSSLNVPDGKTLALSSIQRNTDGESQLLVAFLTCRVLDKPKDDDRSSSQSELPPPVDMVPPAQVDLPTTPADSVDRDILLSEAEQGRFVIRAEGPATGENPEALVEAMQDMFYGATIDGNVDFEITDGLPIVRGNKMHITIDDGYVVQGDQGEMRFLSEDNLCFRFQGNARFETDGLRVSADQMLKVTSDDGMGLELSGSAIIDVNEPGLGLRCSADRIVLDPETTVIHMMGNARLICEGDSKIDIGAGYIEYDGKTDAIKSSETIPEDAAQLDLFSFYLGVLR